MKTITLKIDGMHCDGCAARVTTLLEKEPGVHQAAVSLSAGTGRITYNPYILEAQRIIEVIKRAGFGAASDLAMIEDDHIGLVERLEDRA